MQDTSLLAYMSITPSISYRQNVIYRLLRRKPMSNRELSSFLCWPINSVTPRVNELVKSSLVIAIGYKTDPVTNRSVIVWGVKK